VISLLEVLKLANKHSSKIVNLLISKDLLCIVDRLLPGDEKTLTIEKYPMIDRQISILDSIFPCAISEEDLEKEENKPYKMFYENELSKKKLFKELNQDKLVYIAENILPKLFFALEQMVGARFRVTCSKIIEKVISVFSDDLVAACLEPKKFSRTCHAIIKSGQNGSINASLKIIQRVL